MICAALLFATQNQIHVQIGCTVPRHRLFWHLTAVLGCDAVWCSLFLVHYMAELVPNQIKLGLLLHVTAFSHFIWLYLQDTLYHRAPTDQKIRCFRANHSAAASLKEGGVVHKSLRTAHAIICFGLLTLFFILAWYIQYPSASSFENWLSMTFLIAILLGSQSLIHLFISRMELSHTLAWQLFSVFACALHGFTCS